MYTCLNVYVSVLHDVHIIIYIDTSHHINVYMSAHLNIHARRFEHKICSSFFWNHHPAFLFGLRWVVRWWPRISWSSASKRGCLVFGSSSWDLRIQRFWPVGHFRWQNGVLERMFQVAKKRASGKMLPLIMHKSKWKTCVCIYFPILVSYIFLSFWIQHSMMRSQFVISSPYPP